LTLVLLLTAFAGLIRSNQADARRALDDRFETRAALTAAFTKNYIDDTAARSRRQAEQLLAAPEVDQAAFEEVVWSLGFEAAVLLDDEGRVLHAWPAKPALTGVVITGEYAHLRAGVLGQVAVSEMVASAVERIPVAAVAVPFASAAGQRVLSGAFSPAKTPLGAYLASSLPTAGGDAYLIDKSGNVLASGNSGAAEANLGSVATGLSRVGSGGTSRTVVAAEVAEVPWRVMLAAPTEQHYAPVAGGHWAPWVLLAALAVAGVVVLALLARLGRARAVAMRTARIDSLTGLPNRRATDEMLTRSASWAQRHGEPLAVLVVDLDHFKSVNDEHGHGVGDHVLRQTALALRETVRDEDLAGRWGGEEFVVVLPTTSLEGAVAVAERLRVAIASMEVVVGRAPIWVTASVGVALLGQDGDAEAVLRSADAALYRAKAAGRDAVGVEGAPAVAKAVPTG